jgi:hypothetical protein
MSVVLLRPCCTFRGLSFLAATLLVVAMKASKAEAGAVDWTEMYIPYNEDMYSESFEGILGKPPYSEEDPQRQHLHIYQQPSEHPLLDEPSPVFFFAHANGKTSENFRESGDLETIIASGYSVISWESVTVADSTITSQTCADDFELVWSWFKANADTYNFDPDHVIIGGRSRGTVCSWELAHSGKSAIKGLYMINALPNAVWISDAKLGPGYVWDQLIDEHSPPMHLLFMPQCPKPITQGCVPSPLPDDIHNPRNGQTIVDRYHELGIGSKIQLTDGLTNKDIDPYSFFSNFAASLSTEEAKRDAAVKAEIEEADAEAEAAEEEAIAELEAKLEALPPPSGVKFIFDLVVITFFAFSAAFAYDRYYKWKQSYPHQAEYERVKLDGEVSLQEMYKSSDPRDETDKTDGFSNVVNW